MNAAAADAPIGPNARYYEDFHVGDRWESARRTITEADVVMFAALTGPVLTDPARAQSRRTWAFVMTLCFSRGSGSGRIASAPSQGAPLPL